MKQHRSKKSTLFTMSATAGLLVYAPAQADSSAETKTLDAVTVTATKSADKTIQDVPIAVSVMTGDDLSSHRIYNVENITSVSPSISYQQSNNAFASAGLIIRGIGSVGNNRSFEGSVGVFVDGVYRSRPGQLLQNFFDVESVQVLRGPQGTLFGKNTSAGAILFESNKPNTKTYAAGANVTLANFDTYRLDGYVNLPLSDPFALRLAAITDQKDGEWTNLIDGSDHGGGSGAAIRASASWDVSPSINLLTIADWGEFDRKCCYATADIVDGPWTGLASLISQRPIPATADPYDREAYIHGESSETQSDWGLTIKPTIENVFGGELSAILAYREWESMQRNYDALFDAADVLRISEGFQNEQTSFELLYNISPTDRLELVTGLYAASEDIFIPRQSINGADAQSFFSAFIPAIFSPLLSTGGTAGVEGDIVNTETYSATNTSFGVFGRAEYKLTDALTVFGGLRWSEDKKDAVVTVTAVDTIADAATLFGNVSFLTALSGGTLDFTDPAVLADLYNANLAASSLHPFTILGNIPVPGNGYADSFEDEALSWTLGAQYQITDETMIYASANRGYKAGGVNLDTGARGGAINAVLNTPSSPLFDSEFTNSYEIGAKLTSLQGAAQTNIAAFVTDVEDLQIAGFDGLLFTILNVEGATVSGIEVEHQHALNDYVSFNAAVTWLDEAKIDEDPVLEAGSSAFLSGRDLTRAPEFSGNLNMDLEIPIDETKSLFGRAGFQYIGDHLTSPSVQNHAYNSQSAYTLVNLSAGLDLTSKNIRIETFCQNCFDEEYVAVHFNHPIYNIGADDVNAYLGRPRTFGVTIRASF